MTSRVTPSQSHSDDRLPPEKTLHFYLLGDLRITSDGQPLKPPPYRTHGLLALLLLYPQRQRRDRLIGQLYPDIPESAGRRRVSDLLWLLRRSLPELSLETTTQEVHLLADGRWLDVEAFKAASVRDDLDSWLDALGLYQGDLLEAVYDDWLLEHREALYLQYVRMLHRASEQLLQRRRFEQALALAERLVAVEPYDEKALRTLMEAYRSLGRRGGGSGGVRAVRGPARRRIRRRTRAGNTLSIRSDSTGRWGVPARNGAGPFWCDIAASARATWTRCVGAR